MIHQPEVKPGDVVFPIVYGVVQREIPYLVIEVHDPAGPTPLVTVPRNGEDFFVIKRWEKSDQPPEHYMALQY
jgi:hypothetical protein